MTGHGRVAAAIGVALLLVAAACSGGDDEAEEPESDVVAQEATDGGRIVGAVPPDADGDSSDDEEFEVEAEEVTTPDDAVVWITATEPPDLHLDDPGNGLTITSWVREGLLESLFGVGPDLTYHLELLATEPTVTARDDRSVTIDYELRSDLVWSDGEPLTAEDVAYTHEILTEGCGRDPDGSIVDGTPEGCVYFTGNRLGLDQVTDFEVVSDTEFTVTMASFYPDWRRLYGPVLAAHAYGEDASEVNRRLRTMRGPNGPVATSGPLILERWDRGRSMTLVPNERYHGSTAPFAEESGPGETGVRIDFEPDPQARVAAVVDGRADLLLERARPGLADLAGAEGVTAASLPGIDYDHWALNLLNPHLADAAVREAIALAIDKAAVADEVYRPLLGDGPAPTVQGNTYWLASQPGYVDHQEGYTAADPDGARAALRAAGYVEDDGGWRHPTRGALALRVATIGGDPLREATQMLLIEQLAEAGIEAVVDNPSGGRFFQEGAFAPEALVASSSEGADGDPDLWDIAQFAWAGGPWPGAQSGVYRGGSPGNVYGFVDPEFEVLAFECDAVVDDDDRADCYNDLDRLVTTLDGEPVGADGPAAGTDPDDEPETDPDADPDGEPAATQAAGERGLFMIPLVQRPLVVAVRSDRVDALPPLSASPAGGPLALAGGYRLIEG